MDPVLLRMDFVKANYTAWKYHKKTIIMFQIIATVGYLFEFVKFKINWECPNGFQLTGFTGYIKAYTRLNSVFLGVNRHKLS